VTALLVVVAPAVVAAACAPRGGAGPEGLTDLLEVFPQSAVADGLAYFDLTRSEPPATALPRGEGGWPALGLGGSEQLLESGGDPVTALRGDIDPGQVVGVATPLGYREAEMGPWRLLRAGPPPPGAPPVVTAVPAVAVRRGLAVLGSADAVEAVAGGGGTAADLDWPVLLARAVGRDAAAVLLGPVPAAFDEAARRAGTTPAGLLALGGVEAPLPHYDGFAVAFHAPADGEVGGAVALAAPAADADLAGALAVRAATGQVLGDRRRHMAEVLSGGAPVVREGAVLLPVTWRIPPAEVRADLEAGGLVFLLPGG
jgi:hypothetical protein